MTIAVFAAIAETSIVRISRAKATGLVEDGRPGAQALQSLVEAPERWINALLFIALLCQLVQATLTGVVSGRLFGAIGVVVSTVINVGVVFVIAEAAPKTWALQHTE